MARIVVDAMGSDDYPTPDVEGAVMAAREYGVEIILVGDEAEDQADVSIGRIRSGLSVRVVHAPEILTMEDKGEALVLKARAKTHRIPWQLAWISSKRRSGCLRHGGQYGRGMVTACFASDASAAWIVPPWLRSSPQRQATASSLISAQTPIANQKT
jgi:fatty acid/phospholipid biosynthesis enzyme